jgi:hypothetical protein
LNISLNINNENQDCKIGTVQGEGTSEKEEGEERRLRRRYMVAEFHIPL